MSKMSLTQKIETTNRPTPQSLKRKVPDGTHCENSYTGDSLQPKPKYARQTKTESSNVPCKCWKFRCSKVKEPVEEESDLTVTVFVTAVGSETIDNFTGLYRLDDIFYVQSKIATTEKDLADLFARVHVTLCDVQPITLSEYKNSKKESKDRYRKMAGRKRKHSATAGAITAPLSTLPDRPTQPTPPKRAKDILYVCKVKGETERERTENMCRVVEASPVQRPFKVASVDENGDFEMPETVKVQGDCITSITYIDDSTSCAFVCVHVDPESEVAQDTDMSPSEREPLIDAHVKETVGKKFEDELEIVERVSHGKESKNKYRMVNNKKNRTWYITRCNILKDIDSLDFKSLQDKGVGSLKLFADMSAVLQMSGSQAPSSPAPSPCIKGGAVKPDTVAEMVDAPHRSFCIQVTKDMYQTKMTEKETQGIETVREFGKYVHRSKTKLSDTRRTTYISYKFTGEPSNSIEPEEGDDNFEETKEGMRIIPKQATVADDRRGISCTTDVMRLLLQENFKDMHTNCLTGTHGVLKTFKKISPKSIKLEYSCVPESCRNEFHDHTTDENGRPNMEVPVCFSSLSERDYKETIARFYMSKIKFPKKLKDNCHKKMPTLCDLTSNRYIFCGIRTGSVQRITHEPSISTVTYIKDCTGESNTFTGFASISPNKKSTSNVNIKRGEHSLIGVEQATVDYLLKRMQSSGVSIVTKKTEQ